MIKELCNKIIYDDFITKVMLTEDEIKVLDMFIKRYSIIKMADEMNMSDRNVSRIIKDIKIKYKNYKHIEIAKCDIFTS